MTAGVGDGVEQVVVGLVGAVELAVAVALDRFAQRIDDGDEVVVGVIAVAPASSAVVFQRLNAVLGVVVQFDGGAAVAVDAGQAVVGAVGEPQGVAVAVFQQNQVAVLVSLAWAVVEVVEDEGVGILAECFGGEVAGIEKAVGGFGEIELTAIVQIQPPSVGGPVQWAQMLFVVEAAAVAEIAAIGLVGEVSEAQFDIQRAFEDDVLVLEGVEELAALQQDRGAGAGT